MPVQEVTLVLGNEVLEGLKAIIQGERTTSESLTTAIVELLTALGRIHHENPQTARSIVLRLLTMANPIVTLDDSGPMIYRPGVIVSGRYLVIDAAVEAFDLRQVMPIGEYALVLVSGAIVQRISDPIRWRIVDYDTLRGEGVFPIGQEIGYTDDCLMVPVCDLLASSVIESL